MTESKFCWKLWWEKRIVGFIEWLKEKNNSSVFREEWGCESLILLRLHRLAQSDTKQKILDIWASLLYWLIQLHQWLDQSNKIGYFSDFPSLKVKVAVPYDILKKKKPTGIFFTALVNGLNWWGMHTVHLGWKMEDNVQHKTNPKRPVY